MAAFKEPALKQLTDQQVRFAPPARRLEQLGRAQRLLGEIEADRDYPYQFVCFRITDYRPESYPDLLIRGAVLAHDLALFIEALGGTVPAAEPADPLVSLDELAARLHVSTRTIRRWRRLGLVGRRVVRQGKRQVCYQQSVIDRFLAGNRERVDRGSRFSQMTDQERESILLRARQLARLGGSTLTDISRRIAAQLGRSVEAVRYTIRNYDKQHPDEAVFPRMTGPLDATTKDSIYSSYRRGITVDTLAKRFHRTRTSVYRAINEVRAQRMLEQPLDYIPHPDFDKPELEADILAPMPGQQEYEEKKQSMRAPKDVPPELAACYEAPLLNAEQERHLFRQMNFLKARAAHLRKELYRDLEHGEVDATRAKTQVLNEIERLQEAASVVKEVLINANMRLVVNIAKRHSGQTDNFFELLSDGNMSLIRAVEKFDFGRGFKFSTYASWAIMKNFARSIPAEHKRLDRFRTGKEEVFQHSTENRGNQFAEELTNRQQNRILMDILHQLDPRERDIVKFRYGLGEVDQPLTLEQVGVRFGVTKERIRQLESRALRKLRKIAEEEKLDIPGME